MNLFPPVIAAALLRGQTGFLGGGGLPSPTQDLTLQFSNLAQFLASRPGGGQSRYPSSLELPQQEIESPLPGAVQAFLPQFLQEQHAYEGQPGYGILPASVNGILPVFLRQAPTLGAGAQPAEPAGVSEEHAVVDLSDPEATTELMSRLNRMRGSGAWHPGDPIDVPYQMAEPTGSEGEGEVDYERGEFHAGEPLPEEVQRLLGAMPPPGGE